MSDVSHGPRANVFGDLAHVESALTEDVGAERARAMLEYFDNMRRSTDLLLAQSAPDGDRQLLQQLANGFEAAQRIVRQVWEKLHATSFPA